MIYEFKLGKLRVTVGQYGADRQRFIVIRGIGEPRIYSCPPLAFTIQKFVQQAKSLARFLQVWPVYFVVFSRDCDLCESESLRRYPCFWLGYRELLAESYGWTEGPFYFHQVSRREAKRFRPSHRDRILEAFEDGRGSHHLV